MTEDRKKGNSSKWRPQTMMVRGGLTRSQHGETSEALFLNSGFVYDSPEEQSARMAGDKPGYRILEIGSREVAGGPPMRGRLSHADYVGFDYYPGPNVDVSGDAHRLADLVEGRFDVVYSTAVFEHLAMPWVVAEEIARVLKPGGLVFVETHFSFSSHERPWHFFQFSDMGLRALFSPALGFECVEAAMQNPIVGRFSAYADAYLRFQPVRALYCHSNVVARKVRDVTDFRWRDAALEAVAGATAYPTPVNP